MSSFLTSQRTRIPFVSNAHRVGHSCGIRVIPILCRCECRLLLLPPLLAPYNSSCFRLEMIEGFSRRRCCCSYYSLDYKRCMCVCMCLYASTLSSTLLSSVIDILLLFLLPRLSHILGSPFLPLPCVNLCANSISHCLQMQFICIPIPASPASSSSNLLIFLLVHLSPSQHAAFGCQHRQCSTTVEQGINS